MVQSTATNLTLVLSIIVRFLFDPAKDIPNAHPQHPEAALSTMHLLNAFLKSRRVYDYKR